jgi:hypothetical protein
MKRSVMLGYMSGFFLNKRQRAEDRKIAIENRRMDFKGFLGRWSGHAKNPALDNVVVSKICIEYIEHLWGYFGKCRSDFSNQSKIKSLCADITLLASKGVQNAAERKEIEEKIDELSALL